MTNERQHPDSAAETDKVVSDTYRQLSRESAPDYLNEKVLQQAASVAARPRYSRSIMWTRPLAWAATIALCLAIVLEVTRIPTPEIVDIPEPVEKLEAETASTLAPEPAESKAGSNAPLQAPAQRQPEARLDKKSQLGRAAAKQVAPENVANEPRRELQLLDVTKESRADSATAEEEVALDLVEFKSHDIEMPALLASNECADDARADPVTWLACIADLEESGDAEAALREREALEEAFPQFEIP
jgi:hypothetical protein